jgi:hypothetical protein
MLKMHAMIAIVVPFDRLERVSFRGAVIGEAVSGYRKKSIGMFAFSTLRV